MTKYYKVSILLFLSIAFYNSLIYNSNYEKPRKTQPFNRRDQYNSCNKVFTKNFLQNINHQTSAEKKQKKDDSFLRAQNNQQCLDSLATSQRIQQANDQRTNNIIAIATQKAQSIALCNQPFSKQVILDHCQAQRCPINEPIINDYLNRTYNVPDNLDGVLKKAYLSTKPKKTQ